MLLLLLLLLLADDSGRLEPEDLRNPLYTYLISIHMMVLGRSEKLCSMCKEEKVDGSQVSGHFYKLRFLLFYGTWYMHPSNDAKVQRHVS